VQTVSVGSTGAALSYTVTSTTTSGGSWLSATPASSTTPGTETVSVNTTGLAAGTYTGTVSVASAGAGNSPRTVIVTLNVTAATPNLTVTPGSLTFNYQIGGTAPAVQTVSVGSTGAALSYTVSSTTTSGGSWLSATPTSSTTPGTETVSVNTTGLAAGTYTGTMSVASAGAGNSPQTVAVTLNVTAATPNLTVTPGSLTFNYQIGGTAPAVQTVSVGSTGAALSYTVSSTTTSGGSWLSATPASSTTPGTETVSVNTTGLAAGTYTGTMSVASAGAGNSPRTVIVILNVTAATPSLTVTPSSLTFNYQIGGTAPAVQTVSVGSTGAALSYTVSSTTTSGGSWLSATPASSTTPGTETVSVNTTGLAAGTYTGTMSVASAGAGNSPQTVAVTLNVMAATPNLTVTPSSLTFNYQIGGTAPAVQTVSVVSTGAALSYTVTSTTTSGGSWLSATPASSTTPGTETVSVNTTGLAAGTYTGSITVTSSGAANSPQITPVTLVVSMTGTLQVRPHRLRFFFHSGRHESDDDWDGLSRTLTITSSGGPLSYTATAFGGSCSWLSVNPSSGTTPGQVTVSVDPYGLARGKYTGQVEVAASSDNSVTVPVTLTVFGGEEGAGDRENNDLFAAVYTFDPSNTGAVSAEWVYGAGVPESNPKDPTNQGLVLMNNAKGQGQARAGVIVHGASGLTLTALGFDIRKGSLCTANSPQFQVVTDDGVVHTLSGCAAGSNLQSSPAPGWDRLVFDPAQATPAIARDSTIKSLALMLDDGPDANGGMVVLDNINVNGQFIGKE
jgi:hypothetical protein